MSNKYAKTFLKVLQEADVQTPEEKAMRATLDSGTDPSEFDVDLETPDPNVSDEDKQIADLMSKKNEQIVQELQGWIEQIDGFLNFLNGEQAESIQSRLASAEPDTVLDKMKQSQQTRITRVASDLASLHQFFLGFMAQTKNPRFRYV